MASLRPLKAIDRTPPSRGLLTAVFLLGVYAAALMWVAGGFVARSEWVSRWSFVLSLATNACLIPVFAKALKVSVRQSVSAFSLTLLIYTVCCMLAAFFYDISFDGQTYHAQAILALANGWNPVYDTLPTSEPNTIWVQHYGKGYEYAAYGIYSLTGKLESCKGLNGVLIVASALVLRSAVQPYLLSLGKWERRALLILTVFNPIAVFTLFTFYVDGQIASCLLILLATAEILRRNERAGAIILFCGLLILTQLKFTATVYAVMAAAGIGCYLLAFSRKRLLPYFAVCLLAGGVAVGLVGYNPYVRNFSEKGHPFYPLMGEGSISIMGGTNSPPSFEHKSSVVKLTEASFARSRNVHGAAIAPEPVPKIPFTFDLKEWTVFKSHDVRIGGFGPLWGGALLLSLLAVVLTAPGVWRNRVALGVFAGGATLLLAMTLVNPECWYARYVPQFWWLPFWIAAFALYFGKRPARAVATAILLTLGINLAGVSAVSVSSDAVLTSELRHQLAWLKRQPEQVIVPQHVFAANTARLDEAGVNSVTPAIATDTASPAQAYQSLTLQNSGTKVFYSAATYQPSPLFSKLARYITAGQNEQH